jgi:hypothetical protein
MNRSALNTAIFSRLAGGTALMPLLGGTVGWIDTKKVICFQNAPDNQPLPYVIWDYTARTDENETSHRTQNAVTFIRCYASTPVQASAIDAEIEILMHDKPLTITGVTSNFWLRREQAVDPPPETDATGRRTYTCGAEYRIRFEI